MPSLAQTPTSHNGSSHELNSSSNNHNSERAQTQTRKHMAPLPPTTPQPLHAILLIAKTRSGPRLVAHYPPTAPVPTSRVSKRRKQRPAGREAAGEEGYDQRAGEAGVGDDAIASSSGSDSAEDTFDESNARDAYDDDEEEEEGEPQHRDYTRNGTSEHAEGSGTKGGAGMSPLRLLPPLQITNLEQKTESLARLLAPSSRTWHKRRFEVGVGGVVFLGCPVFEKEGGGWGGNGGRRHKRNDVRRMRNKVRDGEDTSDAVQGNEREKRGKRVEQTRHEDMENDREGDLDDIEEDPESEGAIAFHDIRSKRKPPDKGGDVLEGHSEGSQEDEDRDIPPQGSPDVPLGDVSPSSTPGQHFSNSISTSSFQSTYSPGKSGNTPPESLTMFNLVFVLRPGRKSTPPMDYQEMVQDVYANVVKQLSKALAYQQKRYGFVWTETRIITNILSQFAEEEADGKHGGSSTPTTTNPRVSSARYAEQWPRLAAKSQLAKVMEQTFERISRGEIAHLTLGPGLNLSLQIPLVSKTALVPTPMAPDTNGALWLTTFDASPNDMVGGDGRQGQSVAAAGISQYSALLLLQDGEALEREIATQPTTELSGPLTRYIRHSIPTKSLAQLSKVMKFSLQDIQLLSLHLIHYRRAIAIPPLHPTHTYVVSPNADFRRLPRASKVFGKRFAMLPGLVSILSKLSAVRTSVTGPGPQPWSSMIPSNDHKSAYMEILEWLMRGGWVTQLRTFCWVRVSAEVKAHVERQMRKEEREAAANDAMTALVSEEEMDAEDASDVGVTQRRTSSGESVEGPVSVFSPRLRAHLAPPRPPSEAGSTSTARTAVRVSALKPPSSKVGSGHDVSSSRVSLASHEHRVSDGSTKSKIGMEATREDDEPDVASAEFEPSIILSPHKADSIESRWLQYIASTLEDDDLRKAWPRLAKYFDGTCALEEIAAREGWKRKIVAPMLTKLLRQDGLLLTVRHW